MCVCLWGVCVYVCVYVCVCVLLLSVCVCTRDNEDAGGGTTHPRLCSITKLFCLQKARAVISAKKC